MLLCNHLDWHNKPLESYVPAYVTSIVKWTISGTLLELLH